MDMVSIVIPTHKGSDIICRAVDSALGQDYENIEVIVVDDNGLGTHFQLETEGKLQKYKDNPKVKYIKHEKNLNGSAARNTGVSNAEGKYIALLDDDDIFHPSKIRIQIERLSGKSKDHAFCYTSYENIFFDGRRRVIMAEKEGDICFGLLSMQVSLLSSVLLVSKDAWLETGGFDTTMKRDQDIEFCVRLSQKYKAVAVPQVCMTRYVLKRNTPSDVERGVEFRKHYILKVAPIINSFDKEKQKAIYTAQNIEIAKRYFKQKNLLKCIKYIFKTGTPFTALKKLFISFLSYRKNIKENRF